MKNTSKASLRRRIQELQVVNRNLQDDNESLVGEILKAEQDFRERAELCREAARRKWAQGKRPDHRRLMTSARIWGMCADRMGRFTYFDIPF